MPPPPLTGHYQPPAVRAGQVVECLYRGRPCVVAGTTAAPLAWPVVSGGHGRNGLWVNADLARAIRTESPAALMYWFGVSQGVVSKWRRRFRVARPPGRKRARAAAAAARAADLAGRAEALGVPVMRLWQPGGWTPESVALLGTAPDAEVAARIGRTVVAVQVKRNLLRIPRFDGGSSK